MLINGIDLTSLGAKLYDRVLTTNRVDTSEDWLDGDIQPTYIRQQDRFKRMKLSFLILENDEDEAFVLISRLTALLKKATIKFDDLSLLFDVTLNGEAKEDRLKNGNFIVTYNLNSDYARGEREIYTTDANATNSFKLNIIYYQDNRTIIRQESITLRAGMFKEDGSSTFESIGIDIDKYKPEYYDSGTTNLGAIPITFENLKTLQTLIINYIPMTYNLSVHYFMDDGTTVYKPVLEVNVKFTNPKLQTISTIGQLIDTKSYKPGPDFTTRIDYEGGLTVDELLRASPIYVYYTKVDAPREKTVVVTYDQEDDNTVFRTLHTGVLYFKETDFYDGITLRDLINADGYRPTQYYDEGRLVNGDLDELITFDDLLPNYTIQYLRTENILYIEYYLGIYPEWRRLSALPIKFKWKSKYEDSFSIEDLGIDLNKYQASTYKPGILYNANAYSTFDDVLNAGIIQVYYEPVDFTIHVRYYKDSVLSEPIGEEDIVINDLTFLNDPVLSDVIPITAHRPEGWQFDAEASYKGEVTLAALTQASPISIVYEEIQVVRTKNIIVKYKQQLASGYSVINTSLLTINEADCIGGIRLKDIINLNVYRPDYYESGIVDGYSENALLTYDDLQSQYEIVYLATTYNTSVRYFTNSIDELNWIGSSYISYRVIDFAVDTTLFDLGLNLNAFRPMYANDGVLHYTGAVNFVALRAVDALNVTYDTTKPPDDPDGIDYPHRFLFLQHNDLGDYENLHPEWTLNHAYINTGVTVQDMSKLTVIMECATVDKNTAMHNVNANFAYLFGSCSSEGEFYMRFNNQTQYGSNLTGVNTYEAKAGKNTEKFVQTEETAVGFGPNSGIYASDRDGYSYVTFTYTNNLQTAKCAMPYPLYLFANNNYGSYQGGLANIGIYSCRIYYEGKLLRDLIPVAFYDKIGTKVAPSNCLYDKVTQTFLEDATGKNSFNIIDDERYEDTNPEHNIGFFYVNYYRNGVLFQNSIIYMRESDFIGKEWDPYEKCLVDYYQPPYYKSGTITNLADFPVINFDNVKNKTFQVNYTEAENVITVNYYRNSKSEENLIKSEQIVLSESDFYQAPTFGDLVRLNKYRPEGYQTDFEYPDVKVTLARVVDNAPYDIIYVPSTDDTEYSFNVRYMKKVYGWRTYETIAVDTITLTRPQFRDGEYIDYFIDINKHKPERFYGDGERYGWYEMDERISDPSMLKEEYVIRFQPTPQQVAIDYYIDENDLVVTPPEGVEITQRTFIASTDWVIQIDDFDPRFKISPVDDLPNEYVNKFKPVRCQGGQFDDPTRQYTFEELIDEGHIDIFYKAIYDPNDPDNETFIGKILYWGDLSDNLMESGYYPQNNAGDQGPVDPDNYIGGRIPYIDLGYRPNDMSRLRVEMKCYAKTEAFSAQTNPYAKQTQDYTYFFGYYGTDTMEDINNGAVTTRPSNPEMYSYNDKFSPYSAGAFAIKARLPEATSWVYTANGPQRLDGQPWYSSQASEAGGSAGIIGNPIIVRPGVTAMYRKGYHMDTDVNWNPYVMNHDYGLSYEWNCNNYNSNIQTTGWVKINPEVGSALGLSTNNPAGRPFYVTMDAWNSYCTIYTDYEDNYPSWTIFDESQDNPMFEGRPQVKGSISLFQTKDPMTGKINVMPFNFITYPNISTLHGAMNLQNTSNPYGSGYKTSTTTTTTVITDVLGDGTPVYTQVSQNKNIRFAKFEIPINPQLSGVAIWEIKLYDRDRLVRDLIPVAQGDKVYDYVMPANGLFDKVTEIFFTNSNRGGTYTQVDKLAGPISPRNQSQVNVRTIPSDKILDLKVVQDWTIFGKTVINYYDYDYRFIANQYVNVPTWFCSTNTTIEDILQFNDYRPNEFYHAGLLDIDLDLSYEKLDLEQIYKNGVVNIYYKLYTYAKSVVYYKDDVRVGSKDIFYSIKDIENAETLNDLMIDPELYRPANFKPGKILFDESILKENDYKAFVDAPAPIVVYEKYTKEERPDLFYVEYYRGGAYDDDRIKPFNPEDPNYLECDLTAKVLNPHGTIKWLNHYHSAYYEDEDFGYFIPYQVRVLNKYTGIHRGPGRKYPTLAMIIEKEIYTIVETQNGWGRLKEYEKGWIPLSATRPVTGPGQNPDYDVPGAQEATIPYKTEIHITKLTIDRLWGWCPEQESWVKTEEISFNQSGSRYNGLDIKVIDLNAIDWDAVTSLEDMGIYPQLKKLYYHEMAEVPEIPAFDKEYFERLHEIDFVYPETIYHINCYYYDKFEQEDAIGTASASYSLSDWNPDWDTIIETSWQYDNYGGVIPPTLYRDTELQVDWDFFGLGRNQFKPDNITRGYFVANSRTWDLNRDGVTFREMITIATQEVYYPPCDLGLFRHWNSNANSMQYWTNFPSIGKWYITKNDPNAKMSDYRWDISVFSGSSYGGLDTYATGNYDNTLRAEEGDFISRAYYGNTTGGFSAISGFNTSISLPGGIITNKSKYSLYVHNFSNYRDKGQAVYGIADDDVTSVSQYYSKNTSNHIVELTETYDIGNLRNMIDIHHHPSNFLEEGFTGANGIYYPPSRDNTWYVNMGDWRMYQVNAFAIFEYGKLSRFYMVIPKGFADRGGNRYTVNTFVDILKPSRQITAYGNVYLAGTTVTDQVDWWSHRHFETSDRQLITKTVDNYCQRWTFPDDLAPSHEVGSVPKAGTIVPVDKYTDDSANGVVGSWYGSNGTWIPQSRLTVQTDWAWSDFHATNESILLVSKDIIGYKAPDGKEQAETLTGQPDPTAQPVILKCLWKYEGTNGTWYFSDSWINAEDTSSASVPVNKNYVVRSTVSYYSLPSSYSNKYKLGNYYAGERVTILYKSKHYDWGYTGQGWVPMGYLEEIY